MHSKPDKENATQNPILRIMTNCVFLMFLIKERNYQTQKYEKSNQSKDKCNFNHKFNLGFYNMDWITFLLFGCFKCKCAFIL